MKHTFDFGQYSVSAVARHFGDRGYDSKTRVYGAIDALEPELLAEADRWTTVPVTAQLQSEDPDEAKRIMRGYNSAKRAATKATKQKLEALLGSMSDVFGRKPEVQTFSIKAGCSCGCSPGFILTSTLVYEGRTVDLFVDRK